MNLMKRILGASMAALMALAVCTGCGTDSGNTSSGAASEDNAAAQQDSLETIQKNGKIVVGMNAEFAPYEFHAIVDGKNVVSGFDVELAKAIADDLGVELEIKEMDFDPLITSLKSGQCDVVISGIATTEKRQQEVDFSIPYYTGKNVLIMNKDNTEGMDTMEDLADKKIGIQQSSLQDNYAKEHLEPLGCKPTYISSMNTLVLSLVAGQLDGIITDDTVCRTMVVSNPNLVINEVCEFPSDNPDEDTVAVAMRKGVSDSLKEKIDATITRLLESGEMDQFVDDACALAAANAEGE